jgi:glucose-6-phosphate 1-epimerase
LNFFQSHNSTIMTQDLATLNTSFALANTLHFADAAPGLPVAEITTPLASARVALQGGQLLAWQPAEHAPVIWTSKAAVFEPGKGVRGGVPVCWPWFGALAGQGAHGFVRTRMWQMRESRLDATGQAVLRLGIKDDASTRAIWDQAFDLELVVTVGQTLSLALITRNTGTIPMLITQALHTYFCTGDITHTKVRGLDGCAYLDKVHDSATRLQSGVVRFEGETDRVYIDTTADCLIDDMAGNRAIRVAKQGSSSTVVWNPWSEREKAFADMAPGEYQQMLCVETCNAGPDQVVVQPGQAQVLATTISIE